MWGSSPFIPAAPEPVNAAPMSNTSNLVLPYLAVGQAQKHVTVNESLRKLDALIQLSVVSASVASEPASPADGAVWIIPLGKTGAHWSAYANGALAYYRDGAWVEIAPREGWLAFVRDTDQLLCYTGAVWSLFPAAKLVTVSATDRLLGRFSSGAGAAEEITCTAAGRALIDDADASGQRTTLGLGTAALATIGTSGDTAPKNNTANVFSAFQKIVAIATGASPASSGSSTSGLSARIGASNVGSSGYGLDFGISNTDGTSWLQSRDWNDFANNTALRLNPNGGGVVIGGALTPVNDNAQQLGNGGHRWSEVFAANGVINTSDAREKTPLEPFGEQERRAIARIFGKAGFYQWTSSINARGEAGARFHAGVTAQDVEDAFRAEGLDPESYALFCADPLMEIEEVEETVRVTRPKMRFVDRETVEFVDGKPVLGVRQVAEPEIALEPVRDESGQPVIRDGKPLLHAAPQIEEIDEVRIRTKQRVALNADGNPVMRLGVRYDQLFVLAVAVLFAERPVLRLG